MEESKLQRELMGEEEFKEYLDGIYLNLMSFNPSRKFKSLKRAIKRGHVSKMGEEYPSRPYNNSGNSCKRRNKHSRELNEKKKEIYARIKQY